MPDENPTDPVRIEAETRCRASDSISKIEVALSEWDSSADKPEGFRERIDYLRRAYSLLHAWILSSLTGPKDDDSIRMRLARFSDICVTLDVERVA